MTQEDKELLLKDLCARLPYGCKAKYISQGESEDVDVTVVLIKILQAIPEGFFLDIKPYLRPMLSMTKAEKEYVEELSEFRCTPDVARSKIDFYLEHHIDFRGLIPKGLALEAPKDMYKID